MLQLALVHERCHSVCMSVPSDGGQTGRVSDHAFVLQLCLGGLGLQAWRLQQETLWFGRAGESHPQCAPLLVALFVSVPSPSFSSSSLLILLLMFSPPSPSLSRSVFSFLFFSVGMDGQQRGTDES